VQKLQVYAVEYEVLEDGEIFGLEVNNNRTSSMDGSTEAEDKINRLEYFSQTVTKHNQELTEQLEVKVSGDSYLRQ